MEEVEKFIFNCEHYINNRKIEIDKNIKEIDEIVDMIQQQNLKYSIKFTKQYTVNHEAITYKSYGDDK